MNLSMEYEIPPMESLPMDDEDDDEEEEVSFVVFIKKIKDLLFVFQYESDGEEQEIAYNPACRTCGHSSYTYQCQGKCRFYFHRECVGIFDEQQTVICPECSASKTNFKEKTKI